MISAFSFKNFTPDYNNIVDAAYNKKPARVPLYDHNISDGIIERITGKPFNYGNIKSLEDRRAYLRQSCEFYRDMGYDTVTYERCICPHLPNGGALLSHAVGAIRSREEFDKYPFEAVKDIYFMHYFEELELLREVMPEGMKAIGGVGNGVFEIVQDLTGYIDLCYIMSDDRQLYEDLFNTVSDMMYGIWEKFMKEFSDIFCVLRFGDDLGFNTQTLIPVDDIKKLIVPNYRRFTDLVHAYNKPFLLHSCGNIFDVMDDLIEKSKINSKHSNEDNIAPFSEWVERYGDRIGNFGGIDTDVYCGADMDEVIKQTKTVLDLADNKNGGIAIGSGNSIPDYVSIERYLKVAQTVREHRGD